MIEFTSTQSENYLTIETYRLITGVATWTDGENEIFNYEITRTEFRKRFKLEETIAIYEKAKTNIIYQIFLDDLMAALAINLRDPSLIKAMMLMFQDNVLSLSRIDEIIEGDALQLYSEIVGTEESQ